jgi:hypothetical protein
MHSSLFRHSSVKLLFITALVLLLVFPAIISKPVAAATTEYYEKSFAWDYNGNHWTWNLSIPAPLYEAYKAVPDSTRTRNGPAGYGYLTTTNDEYMRILAQKLNQTTTNLNYNSYDQVSFVLAFVQSLPYTSDKVTTNFDEYPRFPIETLVDDGGDCEDTSILFATLTLILGYGTVYINPPNHYAVGVLGNDLHGTYWTYPEGSNKTYYYCETTGDGFKIGQLPDEFQSTSAYIYPIDETKQYVPNIIIDPSIEPQPTDSQGISTSSPSPSTNPNPTYSSPPDITQPTIQPVLPLSLNLIADNPLLFILVAFAAIASISLAVWAVRRPRTRPNTTKIENTIQPQPSPQTSTQELDAEEKKFCIFCGSSNKKYAVYCEKCGKKAF